jgi:hypothetical protein
VAESLVSEALLLQLRDDADWFVETVTLVARKQGREVTEVAREAIRDSVARLTEEGLIRGEIVG